MTETKRPISDAQKKAQQEMASRVLSRRSLMQFIQRLNPAYLPGWVHEDICRRLERFSDEVAKGMSPRLMLLMPPRAGKSEIASKMFPAWHLGRHPHHELIACSYNVALSMGFSKKIKVLLDDPSYQSVFDTRLNPDNRSTEEWGLANSTGGYVAAGVGGGITGKGAHVLIIDDPIKNAEEADSATTREGIWDWYGSTAYTRLAPGGGVLIIQTWWHDDDLAGRIQQQMAEGAEDEDSDQFEIVKYPAIAEHDEYLDYDTDLIVYDAPPENGRLLRLKGEALHPARYDLKKLQRIKRVIAPRFWSALYQQNPVPDDGSYFTKDQFKRGPVPSKRTSNVFITTDFAITEKKTSDYTVVGAGLLDQDDVLHLVEVLRFRAADSQTIIDAMLGMAKRWHNNTLQMGVEDGQIYKTMAGPLKRQMKKDRFYPHIVTLTPVTDKLARARALQARMQMGLVSFVDGAEWYDTVRTEMLRFPSGVNDDCVDMLAWMALMAAESTPQRKTEARPPKSWKDKLRVGPGGATHMSA